MNVVLYTTEFEPITVINLPMWLLDQLEKQGAVRIAVRKPLLLKQLQTPEDLQALQPEIVTVYCERMRWKDGSIKTILVTPDEELALMLRPEWLTGQVATIQSYQSAIRHLTEQLIRAMRKD